VGKVTPNMSLQELRVIWPMALMCVCVVFYGLVAGSTAAYALSLRYPSAFPKYKGLMMVAIAFPNSFSVPITLLLALGDHPVLLLDGAAAGEALRARGTLLFLVSYAVWVLARWSIGFPILSGAITFKEWRAKVLNPPVVACLGAAVVGLLWNGFPAMQPNERVGQFFTPVLVAVEYAGRCTVPIILMALGARLHEAISEIWASMRDGYRDVVTTGADASGKVQPELIGLAGVAPAPEALEQGKQVSTIAEDVDDDNNLIENDVGMPLPAYLLVLFLRQIVGPAYGAAVACGVLRKFLGVTDRLVLMVAFLQSAGPPMINISVMAGLSGSAEKETAKLLLLTYAASILTWTLSIAAFLHLLK